MCIRDRRYDALDALAVCHRHDARLDRHIEPCRVKVIHKVIEVRIVEEKLADEVGYARVHLVFQRLNIALKVAARGVPFRIARAADVEPTRVADHGGKRCV